MGSDSLERSNIDRRAKTFLILAALLALFLGALDALVVGAAMPTIVSDLGGLPLYSWVFSAYLLARAVSLPIFGKLCDLLNRRALYIVAILIFISSSLMAGMSRNMGQLVMRSGRCRELGLEDFRSGLYCALGSLHAREAR